MSLGYASRLSHREDLGGRLGDPELFDNPRQIVQRITELANLVRARNQLLQSTARRTSKSQHGTQIRNADTIMAFTGAGISTACGIPDFR